MLGNRMAEIAKMGLHVWRNTRSLSSSRSNDKMASPTTSPTSPLVPTASPIGVASDNDDVLFFKAVDTHSPSHDGELVLHLGDIVTDVKDLGNGWLLGRNVTRDTVGIVPIGCLRLVTECHHGQSPCDSSSSAAAKSRGSRNNNKQHPQQQSKAPAPPTRKLASASEVSSSKENKKLLKEQQRAAAENSGKKQQRRSVSKERLPTSGVGSGQPQDTYAKIGSKKLTIGDRVVRSPGSDAAQSTSSSSTCSTHGSRLSHPHQHIVCIDSPDCHPANHLYLPGQVQQVVQVLGDESDYAALAALQRAGANKPQMIVKPHLEKMSTEPKSAMSSRDKSSSSRRSMQQPDYIGQGQGLVLTSDLLPIGSDGRPPRRVRTSSPPRQLPLVASFDSEPLPPPPDCAASAAASSGMCRECTPPPPPPPLPHDFVTSPQQRTLTLTSPNAATSCNYASVLLDNVTNDVIGQLNGGCARSKASSESCTSVDKYADVKRHRYGSGYRDYRTVDDYAHVGDPKRRCNTLAATSDVTNDCMKGCGAQTSASLPCGVAPSDMRRYRSPPTAVRSRRPPKTGAGSDDDPPYCTPSKSYEHIYYAGDKELGVTPSNKSARLAACLLTSTVVSLVFFTWMHYYLTYSFLITVITASIIEVLLMALLAASRLCRACVAISLPMLCTSRGRVAYLIIVTGFILGGPLSNTQRNMADVARSLTCSADQAYNQTMLLLAPFDDMMQQLDSTVVRLHDVANNVKAGLAPLTRGLEDVEEQIEHGRIHLRGTKRTCKMMLDRALQECTAGIGEANRKCQWVLGTLGSVYHTAKDALDQLNLEKYAKKTGQAPPARPQPVQRRDALVHDDGEVVEGTGMPLANKDICEPLDVAAVCRNLNDTDKLCLPSSWAGDIIQKAINKTQLAMHELQMTLQFHISSQPYYNTRINASQLIYQVQKHVEAEYSRRTEYFDAVVSVLVKLTPVSILLLLHASYIYVKRFMSRDAYDNVYVTKALKELDRKRAEVAREGILPLRKYERNFLVDMTLTDLSPPEDSLYKAGLCVLVLHLVLAVACYTFDYVLYWIMALIEYHARPSFDVTGKESIEAVVAGQGIIVDLLRHFLNSFHTKNLFGLTVDTYACVPRPTAPSVVNLLVVFFLYFFLILAILLKAYLLRARNRITAYFYEERERTRVVHLYNVLLAQRTRLPILLQHVARTTNRENILLRQISLLHRMSACCPPCRPFIHQAARCLVCRCGEEAALRDCDTDGCPGVYCAECFDDLARRCPICLHGLASSDADGEVDDEWGEYVERDDDLTTYCKTAASKIYL